MMIKTQVTPGNYVSILTGYTVVVQCEDGGPWTHGTVEGRGDHNHHERSYNICITQSGQLVSRDRKHIKTHTYHSTIISPRSVTNHTTTDPLEDISKQLEKQTCTSNMHTINNGSCINNPTHECITLSNGMVSNQINKEVNSEHMISDKRVMINRDSDDKNKDSEIWQNNKKARQTCILIQVIHTNITHTVGSSSS